MQEDRFDDKIRDLLNGAKEQYDDASWDALSQRLDQEDHPSIPEEAFIPLVKQKLDNHRVPVSDEHWSSFKSDLDYIEERRERLYVVKALEAAIVLLLVYTYFNFQGLTTNVSADPEYMQEIHAQNQQPALIDAVVSLDKNSEVLNRFSPQLTSRNITDHKVVPLEEIEISATEGYAALRVGHDMIVQTGKSVPTIAVLTPNDQVTPVAKIDIHELDVSLDQSNLPFLASVNLEKSKDFPQDGWSIGIPLSYDANFINTDINLGYLSNQIKSGLGGTTFGISIAKRKGNFEFESGLRYSEKTFVPGLLTNYTKAGANSFLESQLDHMVIKQIQVPILGKIYAAPYKKATLYGVAGVSINTILDNQYTIRRTTQSKARLANAPTTDVIDLKNLPKGFLHGGPADENIYLTGVIGFGIQSYMTNGINWYIQPQYQHSFTRRINALVSDINTLSIEAGLKFSF